MSSRRGHFKAADIHKLKERVNHQCSRPDCKAPTSGPGTGNSVLTVGTAAHICAASPGGPRFDPKQSVEERNSIENAIWLCNICSREIDLDPKRFTIALLKQWKLDAEAAAALILGRRLPPSDDNLKALTSALTGYSPNILWNSINNVHNATNRAWEALDPRFKVVSSYQNGQQTIELFSQEPIPLQLTLQPEFLRNFAEKRKLLIQHGKQVEVDLIGFSISGSKLLETLTYFQSSKLVMSPRVIDARLKVYIYDSEGKIIDTLDDIVGDATAGTEIFNFKGCMFDELFEVYFSHPIDGLHQRLNLNINISLDRWVGLTLNELPYFNKIYALFKHLHDGYCLVLKMEIQGEHVFTTNVTSFEADNYIEDRFYFFSFIQLCRKITRLLNIEAKYKSKDHFSWDEYEDLELVLARLERKRVFNARHFKKNITCIMTLPTENLSLLSSISETPRTFQITYPDRQIIKIFDEDVELPMLNGNVSNVFPKITRMIKKNSKEVRFELEFLPADEFSYSEVYEMDSQKY